MTRTGWNGRGMYVYLQPGTSFLTSRDPLVKMLGEDVHVKYRPHIDMRYADGTFGVWLPSMGDVLAEDWVREYV